MKEMSLLEEEEDSMIGGDQQHFLCFLFFFFHWKVFLIVPLGGLHIEFTRQCSNISNILINDVYILNSPLK